MTLPKDLILIRHGQSEANVVQKSEPGFAVPAGFATRHDSFMRLSTLGVTQAANAGDWLRANGMAENSQCYVSPHIRARETAANLNLNSSWFIDDLFRERDWGEYGGTAKEEQEIRFPYSYAAKAQMLWYWKPSGGESLATGVRYRVNAILDDLRLLQGVNSVLAVTHGEFIRTMQFVLEGMTPEEWVKMDNDPKYSIKNCMVVHYSRVNPVTKEEHPTYNFRRLVNTQDEALSPDGGQWKELHRRKFSNEDLMKSVDAYAPLLTLAV